MTWNSVPILAVGSVLTASNWNAVAGNMADSGWVNVNSLSNSWATVSGYQVRYRRIGNRVEIQGAVQSGGGTIFTLPSGFRPTVNAALGWAQSGPGSGTGNILTITPAGLVQGVSSGNPMYINADFLCD